VLFNLQNTPPAAFHASRTPKQPKEEKNGKLTKKKREKAETGSKKKEENRQGRKVDARGILSTLESDFDGLEIMD